MSNDNLDPTTVIAAYQAGSLAPLLMAVDFASLKDVGAILAQLHNRAEIDMELIIRSIDWAALPNNERMRWHRILASSLPGFECNGQAIVELCHHLIENNQSGSAQWVISIFDDWLKLNSASAPRLVEYLRNSTGDIQLVFSTLISWKSTDLHGALSAALDITADPRPIMRTHAIRALGIFDLDGTETARYVEDRLVELATSSDPDDEINAVSAIISILDRTSVQPGKLVGTIEAACVSPSPQVRHVLISSFVYQGKAFSPPIREAVLRLMATVSMDSPHTLDAVDFALERLDLIVDRNRVLEVLSSILTLEHDAPDMDRFHATGHKLMNANQEVIGWYVMNFLLTGNAQLCIAAGAIFPPLDTGTYNFSLAEFDLTDAEVFYLARKVFVYMIFSHGPATAVLAACLLELKQPKVRKKMEGMIAEFWLRNYPDDLSLFANLANPELKTSIKRMKRLCDDYSVPLRRLPHNPALKPSTIERRIQAERSYQMQKDVHKQAGERSLLASLFHKSTLLYGRATVTYIHTGQADQPIRQEMPLQSHEISTALPRMDVLHPARLNYLMYKFSKEKRPS